MLAARRFSRPPSLNRVYYVRRSGTGSQFTSATTVGIGFSVGVPAGRKLTLCIQIGSGGGTGRTVASVSDSGGNTWTVDYNGPSPNGYVGTAICSTKLTTALTTASSISITFSGALGSGGYYYYWLDEWQFPVGAGVDTTGGASGYGTSSNAQISAVTTGYGLVLSCIGWEGSAGTVTGPAGFTKLDSDTSYLLPTTKQRFSAATTWTSTTNYSHSVVAYLP